MTVRGRLAFNFQLFGWKKEANEVDFTNQDFFFDNLHPAVCQHNRKADYSLTRPQHVPCYMSVIHVSKKSLLKTTIQSR